MTLRKATPEDASEVAGIWRLGGRDGHLGRVPPGEVAVVDPDTPGISPKVAR